jgi:hypothetical protein
MQNILKFLTENNVTIGRVIETFLLCCVAWLVFMVVCVYIDKLVDRLYPRR